MKILVIGAGFTGLTAAFSLLKLGHSVTIIEKDSNPGGLAAGFKVDGWSWTLEKHYHHWFSNDASIINLSKEINSPYLKLRPKTSIWIDNQPIKYDSVSDVMTLTKMRLIDRFRMAAVLGFLRFDPFWKPLEDISADKFLRLFMGDRGYDLIWHPQMINKFGNHVKDISLAWFWARLHKRTSTLLYPEGGFLSFAHNLETEIIRLNGNIHYNSKMLSIIRNRDAVQAVFVSNSNKTIKKDFDAVIVTTPNNTFIQLVKQLDSSYIQKISSLKTLGAINLILRLKKQFMKDDTYWLSVCEKNSPVMAVVEHTNFIQSKHYNNEHIVYIGNYINEDHEYFTLDEHELLQRYNKFLLRINSTYKENIIGLHVFKAHSAQPIIPTHYSGMIPSMRTPIKGIYLANMQQVYPWDRGTNYAVELGEMVSKLVHYESSN